MIAVDRLSFHLNCFRNVLIIIFLFFHLTGFSQIDSTTVLTFDFNDHEIKEKDNRVIPSAEGVTLTADRFGNEKSAIYIHGNLSSYLNLSTSELLKPTKGTISLWVNLDRRVYSGKGYDCNPIIYTKNGKGYDFIIAYSVFYDAYSKRLIAVSSRDSLNEAIVASVDTFRFGKWNHLVITMDDKSFSFYINGELQQKVRKFFTTQYLYSDSVMIGHTASTKNERYSQGIFDDMCFFHRILSDKEIRDLYNAPNPNRIKNFFSNSLKYIVIIISLIILLAIVIVRNKINLNKQQEQLELSNKISALELKVIKAQMNPHFISNCLAAIQDLIFKNNVDEAGRYIAKFSFFLRQVLNYSNKDFITLSEEIEIVKLNIELEQLRFKNEFNFKILISDDIQAKEILIPALITQPFIENAIWHGLLQLEGLRKPKLKISINSKNGLPVIEIEDNGIGRDLKKEKNEDSKGTKLITDKIENLNKLYGTKNYRLEIIDLFNPEKIQVGTKVVIQLDIVKE